MAEYIEREAAIKYLENHKRTAKENNIILAADEDAIIKFLREKCPAANVQEVRHGRWLYVSGEGRYAEYECSECKKHVCFDEKIDGTIPEYKGCPHCLARMDGKGDV